MLLFSIMSAPPEPRDTSFVILISASPCCVMMGNLLLYYSVLSFSRTQNTRLTYSHARCHNTSIAFSILLRIRNARLSHWDTFALHLIWPIDWQTLSHKPLPRSLLPVFPRPLTAASLTIWRSSGIHALMLPVSLGEDCVCAAARCPERQWRHAVAMWKNAIWLGADGWLGGLSASSERVPEGSLVFRINEN